MTPFESAKFLVQRANIRRYDYLKWEGAFRRKYRDSGISEKDPKTGETLFKAPPSIEEPHLEGSALVFECIGYIRSSLDHAVYDASIMLGDKDDPNTKFPFGKDMADVANRLKKSQVPAALHPIILSYKPYRPEHGGDPRLSAMNDMRNRKIHRTLIVMEAYPTIGMNPLSPV